MESDVPILIDAAGNLVVKHPNDMTSIERFCWLLNIMRGSTA